MRWVHSVLQNHKAAMANLRAFPFAGLAELTNSDGTTCGDSCPTQAWSSAMQLEVLAELLKL